MSSNINFEPVTDYPLRDFAQMLWNSKEKLILSMHLSIPAFHSKSYQVAQKVLGEVFMNV